MNQMHLFYEIVNGGANIALKVYRNVRRNFRDMLELDIRKKLYDTLDLVETGLWRFHEERPGFEYFHLYRGTQQSLRATLDYCSAHSVPTSEGIESAVRKHF